MLVESEFQNVTVGEQTWRYNDSGQGRAVVLLHGFPDSPHSYAGIARTLNQAGYRTILPYLRGYHRDTLVPRRPYDALHLAEDVIGLLDGLGLRSAVLVGHDWGATLVYGAAALAPDRVDAAVARVKEAFSDPEVLHGAIAYYRAITSKLDRRLTRPIRCPGLMVAGGKDFGGHIGPYERSRGLFGGGAELLLMPQAGHWPHREDESLFKEALLRFLGGLDDFG